MSGGYVGQQLLNSIRYKGYEFPYNPSKSGYSTSRAYIAHKYPELTGIEVEDLEAQEVFITGEGEFVGENAYSYWQQLLSVFNEGGVGSFYHPIYTNVTQALMISLESNLEPREDYVSYSFKFVAHQPPKAINVTPTSTETTHKTSTATGKSTTTDIVVGDVVIVTGYAYYDSYGSTPRSAYKNGVKMTVTRVNYKGTHPIHVGSLGWCALSSVKKSNSVAIKSTKSDVTYVVKSGDTLSGICSRYGVSWKKVASYNNLANPNKIYVGQKIIIPASLLG